jgi:hypothetical protein
MTWLMALLRLRSARNPHLDRLFDCGLITIRTVRREAFSNPDARISNTKAYDIAFWIVLGRTEALATAVLTDVIQCLADDVTIRLQRFLGR